MVLFFGISVTLLLLWALTRKLYLSFISRKFRYRIFELRDDLRRLAIDGKVDKDAWVFDYFDKSFSKSIAEYYYITAFRLVGSSMRIKGDEEFEKFSRKLDNELEKNEHVKELVEKYYSIVADYVFNKHSISMKYFILPIFAPIVGMNNLVRGFKAWSDNAINTPDMSDSGKYLSRI